MTIDDLRNEILLSKTFDKERSLISFLILNKSLKIAKDENREPNTNDIFLACKELQKNNEQAKLSGLSITEKEEAILDSYIQNINENKIIEKK